MGGIKDKGAFGIWEQNIAIRGFIPRPTASRPPALIILQATDLTTDSDCSPTARYRKYIAGEEGVGAMLHLLRLGMEPVPGRPGCFRVKGAITPAGNRPCINYNDKKWPTQQLFCYHIQCVEEFEGLVMDDRDVASG